MNRTHSEPSELAVDELKRRARRRLIGAIVLALAAAVALPLLFESEPTPLGEDVSVQIPPIDGGKFVNSLSSTAPDPKATSSTTAPSVEPSPSPRAPKPATAGTGEADRRVADTPDRSAASPAPTTPLPPSRSPASALPDEPKAPPATEAVDTAITAASPVVKDAKPLVKATGGFVVQVAALTDVNGAARLAGRLKNAGFPGYTEAFSTSHGAMQRVRVGPYPSREAADSARGMLKAAGFTGIVETLK